MIRHTLTALTAAALIAPFTGTAHATHPEAPCGQEQPAGAPHTGTPAPSSSPNPSVTDNATGYYDVRPSTITASRGSTLTTVRLEKGTRVRVEAYTRPSTVYTVVRDHTMTENGQYETVLRPPHNTRLRLIVDGTNCQARTVSKVIAVQNSLSLSAFRNGVRDYTFQGRLMPAREQGGPIVTLYRIEGDRRIITAQTQARPDGIWRIDRRFLESGQWDFVAYVGTDMNNAAAFSNTRRTVIH